MKLQNTENSFGLVSIIFHWLMAILLIGMIILGWYMTRILDSDFKFQLFDIHKAIGFTILILVTLRILWRLVSIKPKYENITVWEGQVARIVHYLFYFYMVLIPIVGWLLSSAAGYGISYFGLFEIPPLISTHKSLVPLFFKIHQWLAYTLAFFIVLHTAAALKHHFWDKNDIMLRMLKPKDENSG